MQKNTVTLKSISGLEKEHTLEHANALFALQKLNPPKTWELADADYEVKDNQIVPVQDQE